MIAFEAAESPVSGSEPAGNTNTLPVQENITKRQLQAAGPDSQIPHTISTDDLVDNLLMIVQELIERTHGRTERDNKLFEELKIYKAAVNSLTPVGNIDGKPLYVSSSETAIDDVKSRPMP
jgi:hypothetical protein